MELERERQAADAGADDQDFVHASLITGIRIMPNANSRNIARGSDRLRNRPAGLATPAEHPLLLRARAGGRCAHEAPAGAARPQLLLDRTIVRPAAPERWECEVDRAPLRMAGSLQRRKIVAQRVSKALEIGLRG